MLTRRGFLGMAAAAAAGPAVLSACRREAGRRTVSFFNWYNYIGKDTVAGFEAETGVKVDYEMFSDEEEMFSKLKVGVRGYDIIVGTDYMIPRLRALDLIDRMPVDALSNLDNLEPRFRDPVYDPGLAYSVPYLWGTTGLGFHSGRFRARPESWWSLWDPSLRGRLSMLDNARDGLGIALLMLGLPTGTKDPAHLARARELLVRQRPLLKSYSSTTYVDLLASGELWLSQAWCGDVLQVARDNPEIDFLVPAEGSFIYVDCLCLVRGSGNREDALRFVDHLLRPAVAADIANTVRYATPNQAALPLLDEALRRDPRVFPDPATRARLGFYAVPDPEMDELWNRTWQEVKVAS